MIVVAEITQETNTFNPVTASLDDFRGGGLYEGAEVLANLGGRGFTDGVLVTLKGSGITEEIRPTITAIAVSGGRVSDDCLDYFDLQLSRRTPELGAEDAVIIALHGAMSSESVDDADGMLLANLRERVGPDPLVILMLDHHANITADMVSAADLIVGHETQPHDRVMTGRKAAGLFLRVRREEVRPATAWRKIPMITPQEQFLTGVDGPMKVWFDFARRLEQDRRVLAVSPFPMQPWLDVEDGGWAVVVHTAGDQDLADTIADEMAEMAWDLRTQFWESATVSAAEAIRIADSADTGLVVVSDTGDAVLGGSIGDGTSLLREMLEQRIETVAFVPLVDRTGVETAHRIGVGGKFEATVGASIDRAFNTPVEIAGTVRAVSAGSRAEALWGPCELGPTALVEIGPVKLVLSAHSSFATNAPAMYTHLGLSMEEAGIVVLKTGSNFQAFSKWQTQLVRADTPGITQSRLQELPWSRLPRPIYPLDDLATWR